MTAWGYLALPKLIYWASCLYAQVLWPHSSHRPCISHQLPRRRPIAIRMRRWPTPHTWSTSNTRRCRMSMRPSSYANTSRRCAQTLTNTRNAHAPCCTWNSPRRTSRTWSARSARLPNHRRSRSQWRAWRQRKAVPWSECIAMSSSVKYLEVITDFCHVIVITDICCHLTRTTLCCSGTFHYAVS